MSLHDQEKKMQHHGHVCMAFLIGTILPFQEFGLIAVGVMCYYVYCILKRDSILIDIAKGEKQ